LKTGAPELTIVFEVAGQPEDVSLSQAVRQLEPGVRQVAANELVLRIHLHQPDTMHYAWMTLQHGLRIKKTEQRKEMQRTASPERYAETGDRQYQRKKLRRCYKQIPSKRVISSLTYNFVIILKNFRGPC
jgi:hypothetical protein